MGSPSVLVALCMTLTLALVSAQDAWMTQYRQHFKLACPENSLLTSLESIHLNSQEDRIWKLHCGHPATNAEAENCAWMDATNGLDRPMYLQCPPDQAIAGIEGTYSVPTRDRQFKIMCCQIQGHFFNEEKSKTFSFEIISRLRRLHGCELTDFLNQWDQPLNYQAPEQTAITGMYGYHDNGKEDRLFRLMVCKTT